MARYRYRTSALVGPWRDTAETAFEDAVRAGQAVRDPSESSGYRWCIAGLIEQSPPFTGTRRKP
jgi:hypothetical protein